MHKPNSKERGLAWKTVAENLNSLEDPKFPVTGRAIRDKFKKMLEKFDKIEKSRASGIALLVTKGVRYNRSGYKRRRGVSWSNGRPRKNAIGQTHLG